MTTKTRTVYLGQEVFFLFQGNVIRTAVGKLHKEGYDLLDKRCPFGLHWFTFDQALAAADKELLLRQQTLRQQLRKLERQRKKMKTPLYKEKVMTAARRVRDLRDIEDSSRTRELKKLKVAENYLNPGQVVYLAVSPNTRSEVADVYRPYACFVLETVVGAVCIAPNGELHYSLTTSFRWDEFFPSREEATVHLRNVAHLRSDTPIHFVSKEEYKAESDKIDTVPF